MPTVNTTMAVVAVNIVWPCPSGRSWTDCRASAKAIAPRSPTYTNNSLELNSIRKARNHRISNFCSSYHCTKVLSDVLKVFDDVQVEPNWPNMNRKTRLLPCKILLQKLIRNVGYNMAYNNRVWKTLKWVNQQIHPLYYSPFGFTSLLISKLRF